MLTTVGQLLVNEALPSKYRDYTRVMDGKALEDVLAKLATEDPDQYRAVSFKLANVGREISFLDSMTAGIDDAASPFDRAPIIKHVKEQLRTIESSNLTEVEKQDAITGVFGEVQKFINSETYTQAQLKGSAFADHVKSKARGNQLQLAAMLSTPGFYPDAKGRPIPVFIEHSYAEGLTPAEFWTSTYGARAGVKSTKFSTREGGDFGKQLVAASGGLIVSEPDCGVTSGVPVDVEDDDSIGSLLAVRHGNYPPGTIITRNVLSDFRKDKSTSSLVVRSPITCQSKVGVCQRCSGIREQNKFPEIGYNLGIVAGQAVSERVAQGALNLKHTSGQKSKGDAQYVGFPILNQLAQVPKQFPFRAAVASVDGTVEKVQPAPQGGWHVYVNGVEHYVDPEQKVTVKPGDEVDPGDSLSSGLINPADIVKYKGIGEGRRYFMNRFTKTMRDSGLGVNRRNIEVLSRTLVNHVTVDSPEGLGGYLPGETVEYNSLARSYTPRQSAEQNDPVNSVGKYLELPALHYTIGTKVTKKMAKELQSGGVQRLTVHKDAPEFTANMVRLRANPYEGEDWLSKMWSSNLTTNLLADVHKGRSTDLGGTHPIPRVVEGTRLDMP